MITPLTILREAIRAVPAVKYALGVAGVVSVIAIIGSFKISLMVAVFGAIVMFFLMALLVVFSRLTILGDPDFRRLALVFIWSSLILVIATAFAMFFCVFFKWPLNLDVWIKPYPPIPILTDKQRQELTTSFESPTIAAPNLAQGVKGSDTGSPFSPTLNTECPEITVMDASKYPLESRIERRCTP